MFRWFLWHFDLGRLGVTHLFDKEYFYVVRTQLASMPFLL